MKKVSQKTKIWTLVTFIHCIFLIFLSTTTISQKPPKKKLLIVTKHITPKVITQKPISASDITKVENKIIKPPPVKKAVLKSKPKPAAKPLPKSSKQVLKKIDQRLTKQVAQPPIVSEKPAYLESVCGIFQSALILPEKGPVKLTITVQPNGKISKMEVDAFESKKNSDYLLTVLPTLCLPPPDREEDKTFTVLFCND